MIVVPSIDVERGRVVKRERGRAGTGLTELGEPAQWARRWADRGARRLHVVDLDGAERTGTNRSALSGLIRAAGIPVQVGGGVRARPDVVELLATGADRVVLATSVWEAPEWRRSVVSEFGRRVGFALDVEGGRLMLDGWARPGPTVETALAAVKESGAGWLVYTDIAREGSRAGFDRTALPALRRAFDGEISVAGGIATAEELRALAAAGADAAIVGRALYDGTLPEGIVAEEFG